MCLPVRLSNLIVVFARAAASSKHYVTLLDDGAAVLRIASPITDVPASAHHDVGCTLRSCAGFRQLCHGLHISLASFPRGLLLSGGPRNLLSCFWHTVQQPYTIEAVSLHEPFADPSRHVLS